MKRSIFTWALVAALAILPSTILAADEPVVPPAAEAAPPAPPLLEPSPEQLRLLFVQMLVAGEDNPPRRCLDHALRLNYGLMALRFAKAPPERIQESLLRGASGEAETAQRQGEFETWRATTSPGAVARSRFGWCLAQASLQSRLGEVEGRCFQLAGVPAIAQLRKAGGGPEVDTLAQLQGIYGKALPASYLADVNAAIYRAADNEAAFAIQRTLFASCLRQVK